MDNPAEQLASAQALYRQGRFEEAAAKLEQVIAAVPQAFEPRALLGELLLKLGRPSAAMAAWEEAIGRDPRLQAVCRDVDTFDNEDERNTVALENCRHILTHYPAYAPAYYGMACAYLNLGRAVEACRAAERALMIDATVPTYYHPLVHAGNAKQKAQAIAMLEKLAQHEDALDAQDRSTLHFLLAKAADRSRPAEAFAHLEMANAAKRSLIAYDEARELGQMQAAADAFTPELLATRRGSGCISSLPVFVVGMPRSGTSLVEQILASHPEVHGAGEITPLPDLVANGAAGADYPRGVAAATADALASLGEAYVRKVTAIAPAAHRIVDKFPYNFLHVGLIHLALPQAKIIHIRRDPLDTCFSCFQQSFAGDVGFAYDLGELGRYYKAYDALMAHWRSVLPAGAMLEIQYEDLVKDLPALARRMVEYCGLEWDARCLEFHKTERAVVTASFNQVRQPLYQSSVGRAEAYRPYLAALRDALA
ncbi:tetratricopeptide repeat-containing sulfotransferase family protein [Rhizomicrobium electricum]|uniref:Tetratricopeptide repeat protein n=1 Tax=Rhizomicrobium electricum TaxID=480070 RepID=A0ABN1ERJ6_9PROT|nr:sulfotransferase [Rhizomicrobium electricum]NIJ48909.1 tetratricopeptide (TPR) repeat protein [Rhizomicrobium electricum]